MTKRQLDAINRKFRACRRRHDPQFINLNFYDLKRRRRVLINLFKIRAFDLESSENYDEASALALAGPRGKLPGDVEKAIDHHMIPGETAEEYRARLVELGYPK